jgi:hypothetical protein
MTEFVPHGYTPIREVLNHLGRESFPKEWTGEEHKARTGLMSSEEWLRIKDLPGTGASGSGMRIGGTIIKRPLNAPDLPKVTWTAPKTTLPTDPCDPSYQNEYRGAQRYAPVSQWLRVLLERGELEAAILDPWSGKLHPVPAQMWRANGADRMIKSGRAQIPPSGNIGRLFVKAFVPKSVRSAPLPQAKIEEAIAALKEETATESLTRPQQKQFVRQMFPGHQVTDRQFRRIFQLVAVKTGRPKKSDKKV